MISNLVYSSNFSRAARARTSCLPRRETLIRTVETPTYHALCMKTINTIKLKTKGEKESKTVKMQPSITKFFKTKQQDKRAETDEDKQTVDKESENKEKVVSENSPKRDCNSDSGKRPLEEGEDLKTPRKRPLMSPQSTPKLEKTDAMNKGAVTTPTTKPQSQGDTAMSPLIDINILIRKKISSGAFALHENIGKSWFRALQGEFDKPYFKDLSKFVKQERSTKTVYPPENKVYTWTHHHDIKDTRVVILGQDPYHGPGQAHGLSFSVSKGVRIPPSLVNIFKEIGDDLPGFTAPQCGDLTGWAKQGVLLLNTCLSVNQGQANSHQNKGWEKFTDAVISWISKNMKHKVVFILWGTPAKKKASMIDKRHKVLSSVHPSPLSAHNGFFGCKHFSQTNSFLKTQGLPEIDWTKL